MKVKQTVEGQYIVINEYDGKRLAGPYKGSGQAYKALDRLMGGKKPDAEEEDKPSKEDKPAKE